MKRVKGFTLIELLVVISIIAVLMAIMMPALGRARKSAMNVVCSSNLKQWSIIFSMVVQDNNNKFHQGYKSQTDGSTLWPAVTKPYYDDPQVLLCPFAKNPTASGTSLANGPNPHMSIKAWGPLKAGSADQAWINAIPDGVGSYGINWYVTDAKVMIAGSRAADYWRTPSVTGASDVPVFGDSYWMAALPNNDQSPPPNEGALSGGDSTLSMRRIAINRHGNGKVNWLFMDGTVRYVGLKELWTLKWSKTSSPNTSRYTIAGNGNNASACAGQWDSAAPWMSKFPEH